MKKKFLLIMGIAIAMFILMINMNTVQATTNAELRPSSSVVKPGDTFKVKIFVSCDGGIAGVYGDNSENDGFIVNYDTNKLELVKDNNENLDSINENTTGFINLNAGENSVLLIGTNPSISSADVYELTFKVKSNIASGNTTISTTPIIIDSFENPEVKIQGLSANIQIENIFNVDTYTIENNTIKNIQPKTNYSELIKHITSSQSYTIKEGNTVVTGTNKIKTGQVLTVGDKNYTLIVTGDTNCDGEADLRDILEINKHRLKGTQLTGIRFTAGDVTVDGKLDIKDILKINKYRLGKWQGNL